jgi:xanthine dehydrogenase accessory factor
MISPGKNLYLQLLEKIESSEKFALATVVDVKGAAPQIPGSSALFNEKGLLTGTIGGGIVEYRILQKAKEALPAGNSMLCRFDLLNEITEKSEAICGGEMTILLDSHPGKHILVWRQLCNELRDHVAGVLVTLAESSGQDECVVDRYWITRSNLTENGSLLHPALFLKLQEMTENSTDAATSFITLPEVQPGHPLLAFLEPVIPASRLIIAGAGHVGRALSRLGKFLGFEVTVWDDRPEFANRENLPFADNILTGTVNETIQKLTVLKQDYLVIVTRGHQYDAEILKCWINSGAYYVGMMGSKHKIAQLRQHFMDEGWATAEQWEVVHTPIGLPIGAKTVEEIAVSIASQLVQVRRGVI